MTDLLPFHSWLLPTDQCTCPDEILLETCIGDLALVEKSNKPMARNYSSGRPTFVHVVDYFRIARYARFIRRGFNPPNSHFSLMCCDRFESRVDKLATLSFIMSFGSKLPTKNNLRTHLWLPLRFCRLSSEYGRVGTS